MARPTKLTAEVSEQICRAIRAGNYPAVSARSIGISDATFYRWMEQGRNAKSGVHRDFYEAVSQAVAESEVHAVAILRKAGADGEWRAAESLLKRRFTANWGGSGPRTPELEEQRPTIDPKDLSEKELKTLEGIHARSPKRS